MTNIAIDPSKRHLGTPLRNERWRDEARCKEVGWYVFFPSHGEGSDTAKKICAQCEVSVQCADYAKRAGEEFGVWGGQNVSQHSADVRHAVA